MSANANIHFRILEDIARDLSGDVNFPTCLDAAILVRNTLKDPMVSIEQVVQAIGFEPLISSKLLRLGNSVSYNPYGERISDVAIAITRLGLDIVRTTSLAVAMDQMLKSRHLAAYDAISRQTWECSVHVAAIARVLARHLGRVTPEEAMLAGLVHNIGAFYLMYRAADYEAYRNNAPAMLELIAGWHESIGESLLHILGLPNEVTNAVRDQSLGRNIGTSFTISDILYFAIALADIHPAWQTDEISPQVQAFRDETRARYAELLQEANDELSELRVALSG